MSSAVFPPSGVSRSQDTYRPVVPSAFSLSEERPTLTSSAVLIPAQSQPLLNVYLKKVRAMDYTWFFIQVLETELYHVAGKLHSRINIPLSHLWEFSFLVKAVE